MISRAPSDDAPGRLGCGAAVDFGALRVTDSIALAVLESGEVRIVPHMTDESLGETLEPDMLMIARRLGVRIAEDNPFNQRLGVRLLAKPGYEADAVANGEEAVQAVMSGEDAAVPMDCQMPGLDGFLSKPVTLRSLDEVLSRWAAPVAA